ncbi:MAG: sigma-70 family RNA polymerase sigma factor [Bifidobacteriaceae bacterium]|jgi:RNA polymerase sigma factor (sigma-70 family)|nr:sigma-70 family RNA polymerase sigma factor [Bifidobacteriaceae bacterium]
MDETEFRAVFLVVHPLMRRYASGYVDPETAAEVAIDTMQSLWQKALPAPVDEQEHKQVLGLCYRICEGLTRNAMRKQGRCRSLEQRVAEHTTPESMVSPDISDAIAARERMEAFLQQLPKTDREVLVLMLAGYDISEIASASGCTPPAAKMRLKRAKEHAKSKADSSEEEASDGKEK